MGKKAGKKKVTSKKGKISREEEELMDAEDMADLDFDDDNDVQEEDDDNDDYEIDLEGDPEDEIESLADDGAGNEMMSEGQEGDENDGTEFGGRKGPILITSERLDTLLEHMVQNNSMNSLKMYTKIFRYAIKDEVTKAGGALGRGGKKGAGSEVATIEEGTLPYIIEDATIFNKMLSFAFERMPEVLRRIFRVKEGIPMTKMPNKKAEIILRVLFSNILGFLENVHEDQTILYVLQNLVGFIEVISVFRAYWRRLAFFAIEQWGSNDNINVKLNAFMVIKRLCEMPPAGEDDGKSTLDFFLKKCYLAFARNSKAVNWRNYEGIIFMMNCYNELLSFDIDTAYFIAFSFIRQIAIHFRGVLAAKSKDTVHKIYNWQYVNCLRLWLKAISKFPREEQLGQLLYPVVEIIFGILNLYPNLRYFPLHLHLIGYLHELSQSTGVYIPTTQFLLSMLNAHAFYGKIGSSRGSGKPFDFDIGIKVMKAKLTGRSGYIPEVFKAVVDKLLEAVLMSSNKLAFVEQVIYLHLAIKRIIKRLKYNGFKKELAEVYKVLREHAAVVKANRCHLNISAADPKAEQSLELSSNDIVAKLEELRAARLELIKQKILAEKEEFYSKGNKTGGRRPQQENDDDEDRMSQEDAGDDEDGEEGPKTRRKMISKQKGDKKKPFSKKGKGGFDKKKSFGKKSFGGKKNMKPRVK